MVSTSSSFSAPLKAKPLQLSDPSRSRLGLLGEASVRHRRQNRLPCRRSSHLYHRAFLCLLLALKSPKFISSYSAPEQDVALMRGEIDARSEVSLSILKRHPDRVEKGMATCTP